MSAFPAYETAIYVGTALAVIGAFPVVLGVVADIVGNDRLVQPLLFGGLGIECIAVTTLVFGGIGWWILVILAFFAAFAVVARLTR